jgi:ribonuclease E
MKKEMLINVLQPEECRIAIIEDGVLEELYVERTSHESYTGNIYKGRIVNLEPAIQAAFVDFSVGRNGFLHVSDIEPQYFDRLEGAHDDIDGGPRDRDRDRKRDPRRGRGRDDRRPGPPRPEPLDPPPSGLPPAAPPRLEERPRERGRERDRDRDRDRGRERERPDQSIKGRRDRSEPPARRFGEGLVEPVEEWPEPAAPIDPAPSQFRLPFDPAPPEALPEDVNPAASPWPEIPERAWDQDVSRSKEREPAFGHSAEPVFEHEPSRDEPDQPMGRGFRPVDPFDPDLPPSRTQRSRGPAGPNRPADIEGPERGRHRLPPTSLSPIDEWPATGAGAGDTELEPPGGREPRRGRGRGRPSPPQGRSRPIPPADREGSLAPDLEPELGPDDAGKEPDLDDLPRTDEPPRRRGGRAAIRSRGGEWEGPREAPPARDLGVERPARGVPASGEFESERRRPPAPDRRADLEARRIPATPEPPPRERERERERERPKPHDRAGEPGYVPRRARLRSGEPAFGADLFGPGGEWPEREVEPLLEAEGDPRLADLADEDVPGSFIDQGAAGPPGTARPDGRRRRRRRGRRRERERPRTDPASSSASPIDDAEFDEFSADVEPARSFTRGRAADDEVLGDLDDLDLDEVAGPDRESFEVDEFGGDELVDHPVAPVEEEIDLELEQEIRREIEEIEELEREMGLRGPADARPRRGEEPARGVRPSRGRGLVKPPIQEIFRRGDEVLVQVIKESIGTKGPTLSTYISIPGRYLVLMPGLNRVGVSRKIVDEGQRRKLREIMHELNPPKGLGFIVRTAGLERTKRELARDLAYLLRLWKVILRRIKKTKGPTPIYQESDMIIRTIRDIFNSEIDTIWIDEPSAFERAQDFLKVVMPRFVNRLKLYDEKVPLFHKYGIEDEIAKIQRRHVPLPEGGSIVIDQTEALVAIDVNSGNFRVEDDAERTAYEMNLRAAKEIARQLRLRDLGGVIVNDFIDMREERHRRGVERALREAIKRDRARTKVLRMSAFGLIEMTRQRIRPSLKRSVYEDCHHCTGAGVIKTAESMAIDVMRLVALATHREEIRRMAISVHPTVAAYLSNRKRKEIARLETECNMTIQISFEPNAAAEHLKIECFDANNNEVRMVPPPASSHKRGH